MTSVSNHDTRLYFGRMYAVWRVWHWTSFPNKLFAQPTRLKSFPSRVRRSCGRELYSHDEPVCCACVLPPA